ncbi:MAG: metallophosphoesterase [Schaedlerella sp.]|nr:metallophosphoesterase [Lachnospiraceae bacterium]MDY4202073.1 metallophosphoesterase [Schaedlerella sp.]
MRVLIVSDTHGNHKALDRVLKMAGNIDMFIHLGDVENGEDYINAVVECEKHIVRGNNDIFSELPVEDEFAIGPYKAFITHGHYYYVSLSTDYIEDEAVSRGADIVMFGHTHRPVLTDTGTVTVLNPGSVAYPRQPGRKGSFMFLEVMEDGTAQFEQYFLEADGTAVCHKKHRMNRSQG